MSVSADRRLSPWWAVGGVTLLALGFVALRPLGLVAVAEVAGPFLVACVEENGTDLRAALTADASAALEEGALRQSIALAAHCPDPHLKLVRSGFGLGATARATATCREGVEFTADLVFEGSEGAWRVASYRFSD